MTASICCLGPIAFGLLGFASVSASLSLATSLSSAYRPFEVGASIALMTTFTYFLVRGKNRCNLSGVRESLAYLTIPPTTFLVAYASINYLIGLAFFGHALPIVP